MMGFDLELVDFVNIAREKEKNIVLTALNIKIWKERRTSVTRIEIAHMSLT